MCIRNGIHVLQCMALFAALFWGSGYAANEHATAPSNHSHPEQPPLSLTLEQAEEAITSASRGQDHVAKVFPGPDGLIGVVTEGPSGTPGIAWLTPHGMAVVRGGDLVGPGGTDLTRKAMYSQGLYLRPDVVLGAAAAPAARGIMIGVHGPLVTVFLDPNCIYCHQLYLALEPEVGAGRLRVRYVVVGKIKASSIARAASLLAAKDPSGALNLDETNFDEKVEEGGYPVATKLDPSLVQAVRSNNALFSRAGFVGTPAVLYCAKGTNEVQSIIGVPVNIAAFANLASYGPAKACN